MLFANALRNAGRVPGARVARIPPHALRADPVSNYSVGKAVNLLVYFYRLDASLEFIDNVRKKLIHSFIVAFSYHNSTTIHND